MGQKLKPNGGEKEGEHKMTKEATSKTQGGWLDRGERTTPVSNDSSASNFALGDFFLVPRAVPMSMCMVGLPNHLVL